MTGVFPYIANSFNLPNKFTRMSYNFYLQMKQLCPEALNLAFSGPYLSSDLFCLKNYLKDKACLNVVLTQ